jgi:hypothetical protein
MCHPGWEKVRPATCKNIPGLVLICSCYSPSASDMCNCCSALVRRFIGVRAVVALEGPRLPYGHLRMSSSASRKEAAKRYKLGRTYR